MTYYERLVEATTAAAATYPDDIIALSSKTFQVLAVARSSEEFRKKLDTLESILDKDDVITFTSGEHLVKRSLMEWTFLKWRLNAV